MTYLVIKQETCPSCNGDYKQMKTLDEFLSGRSYEDAVYCPDCYSGKVNTKVDLIDALRDLLKTDNKFRRMIGLQQIKI